MATYKEKIKAMKTKLARHESKEEIKTIGNKEREEYLRLRSKYRSEKTKGLRKTGAYVGKKTTVVVKASQEALKRLQERNRRLKAIDKRKGKKKPVENRFQSDYDFISKL